MADMRTELDRALTRPQALTADDWWAAYSRYLQALIRRAQARAWEAGRSSAGHGIKNNPYTQEPSR